MTRKMACHHRKLAVKHLEMLGECGGGTFLCSWRPSERWHNPHTQQR